MRTNKQLSQKSSWRHSIESPKCMAGVLMGLVEVIKQFIYVANLPVGRFHSIRIVDKHLLVVLVQGIQIVYFHWILFYLEWEMHFNRTRFPQLKMNFETDRMFSWFPPTHTQKELTLKIKGTAYFSPLGLSSSGTLVKSKTLTTFEQGSQFKFST